MDKANPIRLDALALDSTPIIPSAVEPELAMLLARLELQARDLIPLVNALEVPPAAIAALVPENSILKTVVRTLCSIPISTAIDMALGDPAPHRHTFGPVLASILLLAMAPRLVENARLLNVQPLQPVLFRRGNRVIRLTLPEEANETSLPPPASLVLVTTNEQPLATLSLLVPMTPTLASLIADAVPVDLTRRLTRRHRVGPAFLGKSAQLQRLNVVPF